MMQADSQIHGRSPAVAVPSPWERGRARAELFYDFSVPLDSLQYLPPGIVH